MSKILSLDAIDALLASSVSSTSDRDFLVAEPDSPGGAVIYNFRRSDRISKEQLRSLHFLHDRFALNMSTSPPSS